MINRIKSILILYLLFSSTSLALSPEIEKEMYIGCYTNSKQYIGAERAQEYCICTIKMIGNKYNDEEITELFKKNPEVVMKETEFAVIHCEKNKKAF